MALGQLTHLPAEMAANPFHPLFARFSRLKAGSYEALFRVEALLVRYSWLGVAILAALVWMPLEQVDYVSTVVRLSTLIYPCFFIWSLTRLSGVELLQLMLEGQWTADLLATPMGDRELTVGLASPIWLTLRQYFLSSLLSIVLYGLETQPVVYDPIGHAWLVDALIRNTLFNIGLFFSTVAWIVFLYVARLWVEARLRNGLLKGLATMALLAGGALFMVVIVLLFTRYAGHRNDAVVIAGLCLVAVGLFGCAAATHRLLARNFRRYLAGQLEIDLLINDAGAGDPSAGAWEEIRPEA
jgi:hypothetical protein